MQKIIPQCGIKCQLRERGKGRWRIYIRRQQDQVGEMRMEETTRPAPMRSGIAAPFPVSAVQPGRFLRTPKADLSLFAGRIFAMQTGTRFAENALADAQALL